MWCVVWDGARRRERRCPHAAREAVYAAKLAFPVKAAVEAIDKGERR